MTAMTPGELQAYMRSGGSLYQEALTSSDGHTYSVYDLLQQAFDETARTEVLQATGPSLATPALTMAEALLDRMRADSAPAGSGRSVLFGSRSGGSKAAKTIASLALRMAGSGKSAVRLSIVWFPPSSHTAAETTPDAPQTIRLTA